MNDTLPGRISRERRGHPLLLGLDRVAKRNAFDLPMLDDLVAALGEYEADDQLRCAPALRPRRAFPPPGWTLTNVGETFRQGWKLPKAPSIPGAPSAAGVQASRWWWPCKAHCYTIGIELMLAADINLCASNARFAQLEVQRGILPFGGATLRMHQVAGWGNAMRWLLTGDEFDAHEAYRLGLVQEVTAPEDLLDHAIALAERVAAQAPLGVRATLGSARQALLEGEAVAAAALPEAARRLLDSEDAKEGLRALQERRPGRFEGR